MTTSDSVSANSGRESPLTTSINILTSPSEAFQTLEKNPTKLFPLALVMISTTLALFWYFSVVDFDWYVDDTLSQMTNMSDEQLEGAREQMLSMSPTMFRMFGLLGSTVGLLVLYVLQSGYLSMASALNGDKYRFSHWFSLICWTSLPSLLGVVGMVVITSKPNPHA